MNKDVGLLVLRIGVGLLMLFGHGLAKLNGYSELTGSFPDPLGFGSQSSLLLAVLAEVVMSVLLIAGLITRPAALGLLFTMLVAAFVVHADDPFSKKEMALLYAVPYFVLLISGAGRFSIDALLHPLLKPTPWERFVKP